MRDFLYRTALYQMTLGRRAPDRLRSAPPHPWPGSPEVGAHILAAVFPFRGQWIEIGDSPWNAEFQDPAAAAAFHGFEWLSDLRAIGTDIARNKARDLVLAWIECHRRWDGFIWRPDVLGDRIANWLTAHDFLCQDEIDEFRTAFYRSLAAQARHLARSFADTPKDGRIFLTIKGLVFSGVCLPDMNESLETGLRALLQETERQILPDGGHVQRNPSVHLAVLRHLIDIRGLLMATQGPVPESLQGAIDRMVPMLRSFRLGDGGLVLFNGSDEGDRQLVDSVLAQAGVKGRALMGARHCGFQRMAAGRAVVVVDTGRPPPAGMDELAHAGTLSLEMSVGSHRLIVNCGSHGGADPSWRSAMRATAAHSTLAIGDRNSSEVLAQGGIGRRPSEVDVIRRESDEGIWVDVTHDGYQEAFGVVHKRILYLSAAGDDFRGEDILEGAGEAPFAVRFHLHPHVQASLLEGGRGVLLRLPDGKGWQFLAGGGKVSLDESLYLGENRLRRTEQIVVSGILGAEGARVRWRVWRISTG